MQNIFGPGVHRFGHIANKIIQGEELMNLALIQSKVIGCDNNCGAKYRDYINSDRVYNKTWTIRAHNYINRELGKAVLSAKTAEKELFLNKPDKYIPGMIRMFVFVCSWFGGDGGDEDNKEHEENNFIKLFEQHWVREMDERCYKMLLETINIRLNREHQPYFTNLIKLMEGEFTNK